MIQKESIAGLVSLTADPGMALHREDSDQYHGEITVPAADVPLYTEVSCADIPAFTKADYERKVAELVRERYNESEEFAIQRKFINTLGGEPSDGAVEEYNAYNDYVEQCKVRAKDPALYVKE